MFESKLKSEKVEMVKRIIRRNNYNQYEKTHAQCIELGLVVNRSALDRFADKLQLIDRAELNRRQSEIRELEKAQKRAEHNRQQALAAKKQADMQRAKQQMSQNTTQSTLHSRNRDFDSDNPLLAPAGSTQPTTGAQSARTLIHKDMSYEEVKKRETEITFELGEIRIRESELLQELITLSEMLEQKQFN